VSDASGSRRHLGLVDVDERRTYLPDVDERCLNCGRGYSRHHGSRCHPPAVDDLAPAIARSGPSRTAERVCATRPPRRPIRARDQLELSL
jgi:hypothetical protein